MRKKSLKRKISNIALVGALLAILFGIFYNILNSRAENVIEIGATALDSYGYLEDEEFTLEAKKVNGDILEIELPKDVNSKTVNKVLSVTLEKIEEAVTENEVVNETENTNTETQETEEKVQESVVDEIEKNTTGENYPETTENTTNENNVEAEENTTNEKLAETENSNTTEENIGETNDSESAESAENVETQEQIAVKKEETVIEIKDNRIQLTQEQVESSKIKIEVEYDIAILEQDEQGAYTKDLLIEKTEEERNQIEITEETQLLYNKILKHEDEENNKLVQVKGYLPRDTELKVVEVPLEQLTEVFGEAKLDVAYDITLIMQVTRLVPVDENNPESEMKEVTETIEINPEDYSGKCEVSITDTNILENSQVYHVKDDNTYEQVTVKENSEDNISFEATTFSTYVISSDESLMTTAEESASAEANPDDEAGLDTSEQAVVNFTPYSIVETSQTSINVQAEVVGKQLNITEYRIGNTAIQREWTAVENPGTTFEINIDLTNNDWVYGVILWVKLEDGSIFQTGTFKRDGDTDNTDVQAPVSEFIPETSTEWSKDPGVILKFTDEGDGIEEVSVRMQWSEIAQPGTDTTYKLVEANQPSADNNWQAAIKPPQNIEGEFYLRAKYAATDFNDNGDIRYIYTGPFKIDTKAPRISYMKTPSIGWTRSVTIAAIAIDDGSRGEGSGVW